MAGTVKEIKNFEGWPDSGGVVEEDASNESLRATELAGTHIRAFPQPSLKSSKGIIYARELGEINLFTNR